MTPIDNIEQIIDVYSDTIYRLALSRTGNIQNANDIHSDVFLRFWKESQKRGFDSDEHIKAWLIRVAINCSKNLLNSKWFRSREEYLNVENAAQPNVYLSDENIDLLNAIGTLKQSYRTVIHLFYYEGYTTEEIAELLNKKPGTIRSQLTRARDILKEKLGGDFFED